MPESSFFLSQIKMVCLLLYGSIYFFVYWDCCPCLHPGLRHRRPQQALRARSGRLGEHINMGRWQVFATVGSWGIDNDIIVSHSVPTRTRLNVISTAGSHSCCPRKPYSTGAQTSWEPALGPLRAPRGVPIRAARVLDQAIVCDPYRQSFSINTAAAPAAPGNGSPQQRT